MESVSTDPSWGAQPFRGSHGQADLTGSKSKVEARRGDDVTTHCSDRKL